jgi:hypothetical protein
MRSVFVFFVLSLYYLPGFAQLGCLNQAACNYNPIAIQDDGSCIFDVDCAGICGGISVQDQCGNCYDPDYFTGEEMTEDHLYTGQIILWTVPLGVTSLRITAAGAQGGGNGGAGAIVRGDFEVTPGEVIKLLVGRKGYDAPQFVGNGGGGGSFVAREDNTPMIAAGGGGGTGHNYANATYEFIGGNVTLNGYPGQHEGAGAGGINGLGGGVSYTTGNGTPNGGGGGGFYGDGGGDGAANGGLSFVSGGTGGNTTGGFGGGGGSDSFVYGCGFSPHGGSGGGGWSGGGAGGFNCNGAGGGGGSFNGGLNQINTPASNIGNGYIRIVYNRPEIPYCEIGCMDPLACNFNPNATESGGDCYYPDGCTNLEACNFDPEATCDDGSCEFPACTDPFACNYNASAICDDGNCIYVFDCAGICGGNWILDNCGNCFDPDDLPLVADEELFEYSGGITNWVVPQGITQLHILAAGAQGGGNGGRGALIEGDFIINPGTVLKILVGGKGLDAPNNVGNGGGGGTFVVLSDETPLMVAGGGGGSGSGQANATYEYIGGTAMTSGFPGQGVGAGTGGNSGNGGEESYYNGLAPNGGGGAGFFTNGGGVGAASGGISFVNGGLGGNSTGGFGGGGGSNAFTPGCGLSPHGGSGGGGYSGGGAGGASCNGAGGGGGSFNSGDNQSNIPAVNPGNGFVIISYLVPDYPDCTSGCTYPQAINYNPSANSDDGSCLFEIQGCMDNSACNYNIAATNDDGSCDFACLGCTYPSAVNFDVSATMDNGTCLFPIEGCAGDLNGDGLINTGDLILLLGVFGFTCE